MTSVLANLNEKIANCYEKAAQQGEIVFKPSTSETITTDQGNEFVLTLLTSLSAKPTQENSPEQVQRPKDFNPFVNPDPLLTVVADLKLEDGAPSYNILLNKFPVTPNHILLTTSEFQSQNAPLSASDLTASFRILEQLDLKSRHFGFYNCGDSSGASQAHKHVQFMELPANFVPFADYLAGQEDPFIANSRKEPLQSSKLPFAHFILPLPASKDALYQDDYLTMAFSSLLARCMTVFREHDCDIGYNVIFCKKWIMLVPRSKSVYTARIAEGEPELTLGINSCGFLGLILVKNEALKQLVLKVSPEAILQELGFPNTAGKKSDEYDY